MDKNTEQVPGGQAAPAAPATEQAPVSGQAAPGKDRLSGAELAAVLSQRRQGLRTTDTAATPNIKAEVQPVSEEAEPEAPGVAMEETPDDSQAASGSETTGADSAETEATETPEPAEELPKGVKELQGRVNQLTARLREAEADLAKTKAAAKTEATKAVPTVPGLNGVEYGHVPQVKDLHEQINQTEAQLNAVENWLADNPDGGAIRTEQGELEVSAKQARQTRMTLDRQLVGLQAQRSVLVQSLRQQDAILADQARAKATERFEWFKDPSSPERQQMENLIAFVPELRRMPGWELYVAHGIDSMLKANQPAATASKAKPAAKPPRVAPTMGSAGRKVDPATRALAEAEAAYEQSGSQRDYQKVQTLRRQVRVAAAA